MDIRVVSVMRKLLGNIATNKIVAHGLITTVEEEGLNMDSKDPKVDQPRTGAGFKVYKSEPLMANLQKIIQLAVKILAVLMTAVIFWGLGDVVWLLYKQLKAAPFMLLNIHDILEIFGAFLAVLIAIEIFINITLYLRDDVIHVELVMATALMAIARKVIIFDYAKIDAGYVYATGAVILSLSLGYWLVTRKH